MTFMLAEDSALMQAVTIGETVAANRIFMAPLTRSRAQADGTPSDLAAEYYSQRGAAGVISTCGRIRARMLASNSRNAEGMSTV